MKILNRKNLNIMRSLKLLKAGAIGLMLIVGLASCEGSLTSYNENPNAPKDAPAKLILPNTITSSMNRQYSMSGLNGYVGGIWVQQYAKIQYVDEGRYDLSGRIGMVDGFWEDFYSETLSDLKRIKDQASAGTGNPDKDANTIAIANVLMAWNLHMMTDLWGPIPATEALKGAEDEAVISPAYDSQQSVYNTIIQLLDEATSTMVPSNTPFGSEDLIYNGDMTKWQKLANSLKLRAYMRLSDVDESTASSGIQQVFNNGNYFTSNADNAKLSYQADPYNNPVNNFFQTREDHKISSKMITELKNLDDPRLHFYAMPIEADSAWQYLENDHPDGRYPDSVYVSVINGDENNSLPLNEASNIGHYFMAPKSPGFVMTYSEVEFILAEAALRGWIETPVDAASHYNAGIRASMEMYNQSKMDAALDGFAGDQAFTKQSVHTEEYPAGMTESEITSYLTGPGAFPAAGTMQERMDAIALQKWIGMYGQGLQSWYEWRRLDYPTLTPGPTAVLNEVPKRVFFPFAEQSVNGQNYNDAVGMLDGPDNMTTKVWWDVN